MQLTRKSIWHNLKIDIPILIAIIVLFCISFIVLYSASGQNIQVVLKQLFRASLGLGIMLFCSKINAKFYFRIAILAYASGVFLLIAVLILGVVSKGAQRWLNLGFMRFQPAELMKISVPMMCSYYLSNKVLPPNFKTVIYSLIIILLPGYLIAKQPDLGTSILIVSSGLFVIFFAGIYKRIIFIATSLILISAPLAWTLLHSYQKQRILTLLNPEHDPLGRGYHIIQSKIAIGSGGLWGKGILAGSQSQLEFLPERTTDFIFAVLAEELGLVGVVFLFSIYTFIIYRGIYLSSTLTDCFSRLFSISLILTFFIYIFVNISMVTGILPVVGLPLPLISYGGTSMLTIMASFGIFFSLVKSQQY